MKGLWSVFSHPVFKRSSNVELGFVLVESERNRF